MPNVTPMMATFVKSNYPGAYANWENVSPSQKMQIVLAYTRNITVIGKKVA